MVVRKRNETTTMQTERNEELSELHEWNVTKQIQLIRKNQLEILDMKPLTSEIIHTHNWDLYD